MNHYSIKLLKKNQYKLHMIEKERTLQNSFYEANFCSQKKKKTQKQSNKKKPKTGQGHNNNEL